MEVVWSVFLLTFCTCAIIITAGIPVVACMALIAVVSMKCTEYFLKRFNL